MPVSQKCQYALRAVFELAGRRDIQPLSVTKIAESQAIPQRFLEVILVQLKKKGFVRSTRGVHGGYVLGVPANRLAVGEIIRFIDGPMGPVRCVAGGRQTDCPLQDDCAFMDLWSQARDAVAQVYDRTTFQNLVDSHRKSLEAKAASYTI